MPRYLLAAALVLSCSPAWALYAEVKTSAKFGADCVGALSTLAPKLGTCTIAGAKVRIWCPNGQMFEGEQDQPQVALIRSICNMSQIP
jgi:hypothetical protein